ncbi:sensor histidine kinase [Pedobacter endophyticus]|uniref:Sensor histidine kinase n=1 Tax=Pedobacter endophyticus TaxID=2789740 RepID=A0A7U3Q4P4_9SPHI|nr:sensor histidine kinase [Pedobacter endophyticus]QPH38532.1 sensor histidine kinase [Pedobacter endophyticus]
MTLLKFKSLYEKYKLHLLIWTIFIVYEVFILGFISGRFRQIGAYAIVYIANISLFYSYAWILKKILTHKNKLKFLKIIILIATAIVAYVAYSIALFILFEKINLLFLPEGTPTLGLDLVLSGIYRSLAIIGYSTGYVYLIISLEERSRVEELERQSLVTQIQNQRLENDLIQSQNNYLRSQINPHFLFNTLNFIYNDARKKAPMAADAIMNLAEMMRYALKRPEASDMVPLSEEIEQIQHLINLHKLRTANTINLELEVVGQLFGVRFPPLILLTLVENIFKHGNVSHSTQPALIKIAYEKNNLNITTINMVNDNKGKHTESHHVGIDNINKRLANFYGEEYIFRYYRDPLNRYITEIDVDIPSPLAKLGA